MILHIIIKYIIFYVLIAYETGANVFVENLKNKFRIEISVYNQYIDTLNERTNLSYEHTICYISDKEPDFCKYLKNKINL